MSNIKRTLIQSENLFVASASTLQPRVCAIVVPAFDTIDPGCTPDMDLPQVCTCIRSRAPFAARGSSHILARDRWMIMGTTVRRQVLIRKSSDCRNYRKSTGGIYPRSALGSKSSPLFRGWTSGTSCYRTGFAASRPASLDFDVIM